MTSVTCFISHPFTEFVKQRAVYTIMYRKVNENPYPRFSCQKVFIRFTFVLRSWSKLTGIHIKMLQVHEVVGPGHQLLMIGPTSYFSQ